MRALPQGWPMDFLHFGSDAYWLGHYEREGPGHNQTRFRPATPQQQFGPGAGEVRSLMPGCNAQTMLTSLSYC